VDAIVFELRNWPKLLGARLFKPVVDVIQARIESVPDTELSAVPPSGKGWLGVLAYSSEFLGGIATAVDCDSPMRDRVFELLQTWGRRDCPQAVEVAQRIRSSGT